MSLFKNIARKVFAAAAALLMLNMLCIFANEKPKKIFMVHWQKSGRTVLGETFIKYIKEKNLNVEIIEREAKQDKETLHKIMAEIKSVKPDLIYVYSTTAILEMAGAYDAVDPSKHITDIPIVAVAHSEPIATKIVKNIGIPTGRNVTGVGHYIPTDISLKIMQSYSNNIKKIVVLSSPEKNSVAGGKLLKKAAAAQGIDVVHIQFEVKDNKIVDSGIKEAISKVLLEKPDMIYLPSDGVTQSNTRQVIDEFIKNKSIHTAPIYTTLEDMIRDQGTSVFAYFTSFAVMGLMAGMKAEEILFKDKDITKIPYEIGSKMSLAIREDTMNALGTTPLIALLESAEIFRKG